MPRTVPSAAERATAGYHPCRRWGWPQVTKWPAFSLTGNGPRPAPRPVDTAQPAAFVAVVAVSGFPRAAEVVEDQPLT